MSKVFNVSDDLGKFLLDGWVCERFTFPLSLVLIIRRRPPIRRVQLEIVGVSCCVRPRDTIRLIGSVLAVEATGMASLLSSSVPTKFPTL
jgi:hypothetical protein